MTQPRDPQIMAAEANLSEGLAQARENAANVASGLAVLTSTVNSTVAQAEGASWFSLPIAGPLGVGGAYFYGQKVNGAMDSLRKSIEDLLQFVGESIDGALPVFSMIDAAFGWLKVVHAPVSAMSDTAGQYVINLNNWAGSARKAYDQRVPIQVKGIDTLAEAGGHMATWLGELVAVNASYIWMLVKPLFDIGSVLAAALVDAGTIVGALEAIGKCAEAVEVAVQAIWEQVDALIDQLTALVNKMLEARKIIGTLGDSWPDMVTFE